MTLSFLGGYPVASVITCATLHISSRGYYGTNRQGIPSTWQYRHTEEVQWRTLATVFNLALDPITSVDHPLSNLELVAPYRSIISSEFDTRFFRDASRSQHYVIGDQHHNAVAAQCLSFLALQTFPKYTSSLVRTSRLKTHPWHARRSKGISRGLIPPVIVELPTRFLPGETPSWSVQLLLSLHLALLCLPSLLHSATHSEDLVALAKFWGNKRYLYHIFPLLSAQAGKAVKKYLLRVNGIDGYAVFLDIQLLPRY